MLRGPRRHGGDDRGGMGGGSMNTDGTGAARDDDRLATLGRRAADRLAAFAHGQCFLI